MELPKEAFSGGGRIRTRWSLLLLSIGLRYCGKCKKVLGIEEFGFRNESRFQSHCRSCNGERAQIEFGGKIVKTDRKLTKRKLTKKGYEEARLRTGYHRCSDCGGHFKWREMQTWTLCYDCAAKIFEDSK